MFKRGQVTIYIIIAVIIAAALLILFYPKIKDTVNKFTTVPSFESCINDKIEEGVRKLEANGGSISPVLAFNDRGKRIEYLCFINEYYKTCQQQQPMLRQHMERELKDYIRNDITQCMEATKSEMIKRGYRAESTGKGEFNLEIVPNQVRVTVKSDVAFVKEDTKERFEKFEANYRTNLYDLAMLTLKIVNWEASYGDVDIVSLMMYNPDIKIEKYKQEDGTKLYILTDRTTGEQLYFASRSLAWSPGFGFTKIVRV